MLQAYTKQEDIPEALREYYSKREDGQWHADIPDAHPAVKHNAKLLSEKQTAETKVTQLTSDLESARAGNLGRGQVAISTSDAKLLDQYKALGTPDEVGAIKTEHATLKAETDKRKLDDTRRQMAKDLGYTNVEAFVRLPNLPEFEPRTKDGKTEWVAKLKDGNGTIIEKAAKEFIESSPDIQPFMPALKQSQSDGVRVPTTGPSIQPVEGDQFAWARNFGKQWNEERKPASYAGSQT